MDKLHNLNLKEFARDIFLENMGDAFIVFNKDNRIIDANKVAKE